MDKSLHKFELFTIIINIDIQAIISRHQSVRYSKFVREI